VELPGSGDELLKDAFTLLRDYATNMLLQPGEIDEERGVILAEKRYRNSVEYRMMLDGLNFSLPESRIPARMPIGDEAVIANAGRERFTAFYNTWYTPDRMMVAVVGDIEPARFEALIQQYFGDIQAPAEPPPIPTWAALRNVASRRASTAKPRPAASASTSPTWAASTRGLTPPPAALTS
jgi:zinc protease